LRVASLGIGLVGVVFLSVGDFRQASFGSMKYLTGNLLIFGGCFGSSFYNVYCKGLMQKFEELEILIYSYITASIASIPLLIWAEPFHLRSMLTLDAKATAAFLFLALFMYGASMLLFFKALQHLDVTTASMSLYLVPVFGVILATLLLGEKLNLATVLGAAIVLISTLLVVRYDTSY
jgi:drug/metabolite transporter (DMT)-like permease